MVSPAVPKWQILPVIVLLPCVWGACGDDFESASKVDGLRVLGIRASLPAILVNNTTLLDALVYPESGVDYQWSICLASAGSVSAFECVSDELECSLGTGPTVEVNLAAVATACLGEQKAQEVMQQLDSEGDQDSTIVYARLVVSSGDDEIEAVKSVRIQKEPPLNINPALSGIQRDGIDWGADTVLTVQSKSKLVLLPLSNEQSRETYEGADGEEAAETFTYAWYATEGSLEKVFTYDDYPSNVWKAPVLSDGEKDREGILWLVLRDGRGGVDWLSRRIVIESVETAP